MIDKPKNHATIGLETSNTEKEMYNKNINSLVKLDVCITL